MARSTRRPLLRSKLPDPHGLLGRRTFLHPVVISAALFERAVEGWTVRRRRSTRTTSSDPADRRRDRLQAGGTAHPPVIFASTLPGYGREQSDELLAQFPKTQALLALMRDGFHEQSPGGASRCATTAIAAARLSAHRLRDGRRAACLPQHGRDPVRRRREGGAAGARNGAALHLVEAGARGDRGLPMKPLLTRAWSART